MTFDRPFRSDRSWTFDRPAVELWTQIDDTGAYSSWWPWLRRFEADDGLVQGAEWTCEVSPPLPYVVRFTVHLDDVRPPARAHAVIAGDIEGSAVLTIDDLTAGTSRARLVSSLLPVDRILRSVGVVARPAVRWGHDWVLDRGREQFVRHTSG